MNGIETHMIIEEIMPSNQILFKIVIEVTIFVCSFSQISMKKKETKLKTAYYGNDVPKIRNTPETKNATLKKELQR